MTASNNNNGNIFVQLLIGLCVALVAKQGPNAGRWLWTTLATTTTTTTSSPTNKRGPATTQWQAETEVIPNFLSDPLKGILQNRSLWGEHGFDSVWWSHPTATTATDPDDDGNDIWRQVAWQIYRDHPLMSEAVGIEYWVNVITAESPLGWHIDKDEDSAQGSDDDDLVTPLWGAVYYGYPSQFRGGYLEILPGGAHQVWPAEDQDEMERFRPEYNRLVRFNASCWHRVTPVTDHGERLALAVNLWHVVPKRFADAA